MIHNRVWLLFVFITAVSFSHTPYLGHVSKDRARVALADLAGPRPDWATTHSAAERTYRPHSSNSGAFIKGFFGKFLLQTSSLQLRVGLRPQNTSRLPGRVCAASGSHPIVRCSFSACLLTQPDDRFCLTLALLGWVAAKQLVCRWLRSFTWVLRWRTGCS